MSEWSELCSMMNIDNDEDALENMIDQFIADDKEYGLIADHPFKPSKEPKVVKSNKSDGSVFDDIDIDGDIPF